MTSEAAPLSTSGHRGVKASRDLSAHGHQADLWQPGPHLTLRPSKAMSLDKPRLSSRCPAAGNVLHGMGSRVPMLVPGPMCWGGWGLLAMVESRI